MLNNMFGRLGLGLALGLGSKIVVNSFRDSFSVLLRTQNYSMLTVRYHNHSDFKMYNYYLAFCHIIIRALTVTSHAVSRGCLASLVGERFASGGLRVY